MLVSLLVCLIIIYMSLSILGKKHSPVKINTISRICLTLYIDYRYIGLLLLFIGDK